MKDLIKIVRDLPKPKRKIIFWSVIVIIGLGLFTFYIKNVQKRIKNFEIEKFKEDLNLPSLEETIKELPKIEMPEIKTPETEEKLEKMIEEEELSE